MKHQYNPIQTYSTVQRWLANIPNHNTQKFYLYSLRKYVNQTNTNPDNLISIGQKNGENAHDQLKIFYNMLQLSPGSKMSIYQAIRSFYAANRVTLGKKPRPYRMSIEYEPRKLYTQNQVAQLVDAASNLRDKALITFLAQTGQRIGVVTSLRLRHVNLDEPSPIVVEIPAILRNSKGLNVNKAQTVYHFVFGEDTANYLRFMIKDRKDRGESLGPDSWLFRSHSKWIRGNTIHKVRRSTPGLPLSISQAELIVRMLAERRDIQEKFGKRYLFHPHGFRRYWKHQLRMGGVDPVLLDYMMGHVVGYGGAYDRWTLDDIKG
jgi:integrase